MEFHHCEVKVDAGRSNFNNVGGDQYTNCGCMHSMDGRIVVDQKCVMILAINEVRAKLEPVSMKAPHLPPVLSELKPLEFIGECVSKIRTRSLAALHALGRALLRTRSPLLMMTMVYWAHTFSVTHRAN